MLVTIDPSQNSLGMAFFSLAGLPHTALHIKRKVSTPGDWHSQAMQMATAVSHTVAVYRYDEALTVLIELPANWFGVRGMHSKNSGAIQKLYFTTGAICAFLQTEPTCVAIWGVSPSSWKGQVSKDIMLNRARNYCTTHEIDIQGCADDVAEALLLGKYAFEHKEISNDFTLRFQKPIVQVSQSSYVERVGTKVDNVPEVRDFSMLDFTYYSR